MNNNSQKGFAMPVIIAMVALALALVLSGVVYYASKSKEAYKMTKEKAMEEKELVMEKKEGEVMTKSVSVTMTAQNASGQTGVATLTPMDGKTKVVIAIPEGVKGVTQPAHIHIGACPNPGAVAYPLTSVTNGASETILDVSIDALYEKLPLAINVHKSKDEVAVYTSCGDLSGDAMSATIDKNESMIKKDEGVMSAEDGKYSGEILAGKSAPLLDFVKADYDAALETDRLVVLYFYANWCPICKAEFPVMQKAFNDLTTDKVIGFRVNYNDKQTDNDEENLAKQFGVAYQHTKVFVKNGQRILKSPETWDEKRYETEISKNLSQ